MKNNFWISNLPIFFYGALKIAIFEVFWQKYFSFSKMWQKFLTEISVPWAPTPYPKIVRFKSWSDRKFLVGVTEPFRTATLAFLEQKIA